MTRSATWPTDPQDQRKAILGALWAVTALCIITIALRVYVRIKVSRTLAAHDWIMFFAMLLQIDSQACITEAYHSGLGAHDMNLIYDSQGKFISSMPWTNLTKWVCISIIPGVLASIFSRVSITLLLVGLLGTKRWLKWFLVVATGCVTVVGYISVIFTWVQASPVEGLWNPLLPAQRRNQNIPFEMVFAVGASYFCLYGPRLCAVTHHHHLATEHVPTPADRPTFSIVSCIMRIMTSHDHTLYKLVYGMLWAGLEQCLVIILGSEPPLAAVRQLDFSGMGASLSKIVNGSLFGTRRAHGGSSASRGNGGSGSGRSSSDSIKPAGVYERALWDHDVEAAKAFYPSILEGSYKMNYLQSEQTTHSDGRLPWQ